MSLTKSSAPTRRPSLLLLLIVLSIAITAISYVADYFVRKLPATNGPRQQLVDLVTQYAPTVMWVAGGTAAALIALGPALIVLKVVVSVLRSRGRSAAGHAPSSRNHDIVQALAYHMKVSPDLVRKCSAKQAALEPAREAVEHYRALAEADPAAYLPDLAMSLWALAWGQAHESGPQSSALVEALDAAENACHLYENLTQNWPKGFEGHLQAARATLTTVRQLLEREQA